jgi:hypothetical protein
MNKLSAITITLLISYGSCYSMESRRGYREILGERALNAYILSRLTRNDPETSQYFEDKVNALLEDCRNLSDPQSLIFTQHVCQKTAQLTPTEISQMYTDIMKN